MVDLTPYRGKRALVCGIPSHYARTHHRWVSAKDKALALLGITKATTYVATRTVSATREAISIVSADVVIVCASSFAVNIAREAARLAGVPVLRVRRDGNVEVDQCD